VPKPPIRVHFDSAAARADANIFLFVELSGVEHPDVEDDNDFVDAMLDLLSSVSPENSVLRTPAAPMVVPSTTVSNFLNAISCHFYSFSR